MYKIEVDITDNNHIALLNKEYLVATFEGHESELIGELGEMDDETFEEMKEEINENLWFFMMDCFSKVERQILRERRNVGAEKENEHYVVYWKNPNAHQNEFEVVRRYKVPEDAQDYVRDQFIDEFTTYKITKVLGGVENDMKIVNKETLGDKFEF